MWWRRTKQIHLIFIPCDATFASHGLWIVRALTKSMLPLWGFRAKQVADTRLIPRTRTDVAAWSTYPHRGYERRLHNLFPSKFQFDVMIVWNSLLRLHVKKKTSAESSGRRNENAWKRAHNFHWQWLGLTLTRCGRSPVVLLVNVHQRFKTVLTAGFSQRCSARFVPRGTTKWLLAFTIGDFMVRKERIIKTNMLQTKNKWRNKVFYTFFSKKKMRQTVHVRLFFEFVVPVLPCVNGFGVCEGVALGQRSWPRLPVQPWSWNLHMPWADINVVKGTA